MDDRELLERGGRNAAEFERLKLENERFQEEFARLRREAEELGMDMSDELPLDVLTPEQRSYLREMELRTDRDIRDIMDDTPTAKPAFKAGRVMV